jgi:hypothetical protein
MGITYDLATLPEGGAVFHSGVAELTRLEGRAALRVSLNGQMTRYDVPGTGYVDLPTFVALPIWFEDGSIEVDVLSRLNDSAPDSAQPLAGLAYRICGDRDRFDAVQVHPLTGTSLNPPSPRTRRAAQFFAYPEWPFDRLWPKGPSESGEDIVPDSWTRLTLHIDGTRLTALVNGVEALVIPVTKAAARRGDLGLFVDVGTEAYFSNLRITPV